MAFGLGKRQAHSEMAEIKDEDIGWLGAGIEIEGRMKVNSGLVRLDAHFKGEIVGEGTLVVNDRAEIEAEIHTRLISVAGKVKGVIHASERLEIKEHGIVLGDIYTPCLLIEPGGYFDGQCHMPTPEPEKQVTPEGDTTERP